MRLLTCDLQLINKDFYHTAAGRIRQLGLRRNR
jgi:hypothetical protein